MAATTVTKTMKTSRDLAEELDLSFLSPEEELAIREVLLRDDTLKKQETGRVRLLRLSVPDPAQLKVMTGEWFQELRTRRHGRQSDGTEVVRSSMRRKKTTATRSKVIGNDGHKEGERTVEEKEKEGTLRKEEPLLDTGGQASLISFVNPAFRKQQNVENVTNTPQEEKDNEMSSPGIQKQKEALNRTSMGTASVKDGNNQHPPSNQNFDYFSTTEASLDQSSNPKAGQHPMNTTPSPIKDPPTNEHSDQKRPPNQRAVNRDDIAYLESSRVLILPPELRDQPEQSVTVMSLEPNTPTHPMVEVPLTMSPVDTNLEQSTRHVADRNDSLQATNKQPHKGRYDPKDSIEKDSTLLDSSPHASVEATVNSRKTPVSSSSAEKSSTTSLTHGDRKPAQGKTALDPEDTAEVKTAPKTSTAQPELKAGSVGARERESTEIPIPVKRERQVPPKPERKRDSIGVFAKPPEKTESERGLEKDGKKRGMEDEKETESETERHRKVEEDSSTELSLSPRSMATEIMIVSQVDPAPYRREVKKVSTTPKDGVKEEVLFSGDKGHDELTGDAIKEEVKASGAAVTAEVATSKKGVKTEVTSDKGGENRAVTSSREKMEGEFMTSKPSITPRKAVKEEMTTPGMGVKKEVTTSGEVTRGEVVISKKGVTEEVPLMAAEVNKESMNANKVTKKEVTTPVEGLKGQVLTSGKLVLEEVTMFGAVHKDAITVSTEGVKGETATSREARKEEVKGQEVVSSRIKVLRAAVKEDTAISKEVVKAEVATSREGVKAKVTAPKDTVKPEVTISTEGARAEVTISKDGVTPEVTTSGEGVRAEITASKDEVKPEVTTSKDKVRAKITASKEGVTPEVMTPREKVRAEVTASMDGVKPEVTAPGEGVRADVNASKDGFKMEVIQEREGRAAAIPTIILDSSDPTETEEDEAGNQEVRRGDVSEDTWEDETAYSDDDRSSVSSYGSEFYDRKAYGSTNALSVGGLTGSMLSVYSDAGDFGDVAVQGSVEFSLQYSPKGELLVLVAQCQDLAYAKARKRRTDPYVKTYLNPDKSRNSKKKTSIKKRTVNPIFSETLKYKMSMEELRSKTLSLSVWHNDPRGRNVFLGQVELELASWDWGYTTLTWYNLMPKGPKGQEGPEFQGWLTIALKYSPGDAKAKSGEINVWLKEARELKKLKPQGVDSFVKCYMLPDSSKKSRQKTRVMKKSQEPVYNHAMVYDGFRGDEAREACCELTVWDHNALSNQFLGGVRLSLGTGLSYGKKVDWMDSVGQEVALWEKMLANQNSWVEGEIPLRSVMTPRK